jgi:hypothetical protein
MPLRVEAYLVGGVLRGVVARADHLRDVVETATDVLIERAVWAPLDGTNAPAGEVLAQIDDLVMAVGDEIPSAHVHAAWHPIRLEAGPYTIHADLPTMPGFDPGRALTRPTGTFVHLANVRIWLRDRPAAGAATHEHAFVNRYSVDAVDADLMLGFFFPGARIEGELLRAANGDLPAASAVAPPA